KLIEAARWSPSGENEQPWRLVVVRDPDTKAKIAEIAKLGTGGRVTAEYSLSDYWQRKFAGVKNPETRARLFKTMYTGQASEFAGNAPVVIVVIGELYDMFDTPYDLSCAIMSILLEAHSLGLGACWVHGPSVYPSIVKKMKELLKIPTGMGQYKLIATVSLGWPAESPKAREKKEFEDIVFWEEFGRKERP
ncbi:nitroreductase family protein, partial [Chloroflexota bacterium]